MKSLSLYSIYLAIILMLFSCGDKKQNNTNEDAKKPISNKLTKTDISKLKFLEFNLDANTKRIVEKWDRFAELETIISDVKKADFSYLKQNHDTLSKFIKQLKQKIPDTINTPSIQARLVALETKLFKLENMYNLSNISKNELGMTVKEFLESVSNLNLQMNKKLELDSRSIEKP